MRCSLCLVALCASGLAAAEISEKFAKRLESADTAYQSAVQKADNTRFYAVQKASQERMKLLKAALADATKAGDFDAATEIKARVAAAESSGGVRAKPKNVVKIGMHEYALIEEKVTWHTAKRLCEEMGGHLVVIDNQAEEVAIKDLCRTAKQSVWIGATDEDVEGDWRWVTGGSAKDFPKTLDNAGNASHHLAYFPVDGSWNDTLSGERCAFCCEWDR